VSATPESHTRSQVLALIRERILIYGTSHVGRDSAEDLAQDTLLLIEQRYSHLGQIGDLLPVAIRIMSFKLKSFRRSVGRRRVSDTPVDEMPLADGDPDAATQLETAELKTKIYDALDKLGSRCKRLFLLKLEGHRLPQIREMLGASTMQQLYMWDFRCRESMRQLIGYRETK
jgi:RNA polymerase sigma-70 factor (ECF subfamily)